VGVQKKKEGKPLGKEGEQPEDTDSLAEKLRRSMPDLREKEVVRASGKKKKSELSKRSPQAQTRERSGDAPGELGRQRETTHLKCSLAAKRILRTRVDRVSRTAGTGRPQRQNRNLKERDSERKGGRSRADTKKVKKVFTRNLDAI